MVALYSTTGEEPHRGRLKRLYPRAAFKCSDGYLAMNVPDNLIWKRLCQTMGREDLITDPRSANGTARAANAAFLDPIIEGWLMSQTREEAGAALNANGVPVGPVYTAKDVFADPQVAARKMLLPVEDADVGTYRFARSPVLLSSSPDIKAEPAPDLGQHSSEILSELLGYDSADIEQLTDQGVVG
jgi:CoA:oxalate CoA-transferase